MTNAGISDRVPRLPFVSAVDGNCPELLFRELLDGLFRQPAEFAFAKLVVVVEVRRVDRMH